MLIKCYLKSIRMDLAYLIKNQMEMGFSISNIKADLIYMGENLKLVKELNSYERVHC